MTVEPAGLTLSRVNEQVFAVQDAQGRLVGNLKLIGTVWKFKAVGVEPDGGLVPGGGPFTHRHNITFVAPDAALVSLALLGPDPH
jgi:hypothetical protein